MLISICIASVRNHTLPHLVNSIIAQSYKNWELIIAIQGEEPALLAHVKQVAKLEPRVSFIQLQERGKNNALNHAIAVAKGDLIAFTDDDCIAPPDWLATFITCFQQERSVGIVAGNLVAAPAKPLQISACPATYTIECIYRPAESGFAGPPGFYWSGGNYAVRHSVIDLVGPFDKYLGPGTAFPVGDDTDFALRAEQVGVVMWTTPTSVIHHTYGRRYGIKNVLKHHSAYARGEGGLIAKLRVWGHRLSAEWEKGTRPLASAKYFCKHPSARRLLELYKARHRRIAFEQYLAKYEVNANFLSIPKKSVGILLLLHEFLLAAVL